MELVMLCIALFVFFFGSVVALQTLEFGFRVGDKALESSGKLVKLIFKGAFNLIYCLSQFFIHLFLKKNTEAFTIKTIFAVTPLQLQQRNNKNI